MEVKKKNNIILKLIMIIIILLISVFPTISFSESSTSINTTLGTITLKCANEKVKVGDEVPIEIYVGDSNLLSFYCQLKYDKEVFDIVNIETDVKTIRGWTAYEGINNEDGTEMFLYANGEEYACSNTLLATIYLKVIKDTDIGNFYLNNVVISDTNYKDSLDEEGCGQNMKITLVGKKDNEEDDKGKKLYLSSETYKIGNNDINNYEENDKYISRVIRKTTKETFISKLKTNGTIRIIKEDGTELGENEFVGTGMTIVVTKEEEKIEMQIAVMGDLSGDGKVTAQDLSTIKDCFLGQVELKDIFFVAADFDEVNEMKTSYLSEINHMCLE